MDSRDGAGPGEAEPRYRAVDPKELLPCPFCGSADVQSSCVTESWFLIRCRGCGIEMENHDSTSVVVKLWNARPASPDDAADLAREVERLRGDLRFATAAAEDKRARFRRLLVAFHDATRRPLGVTPASGDEFYDWRLAGTAEEYRPRIGTEEERRERPEVRLVAAQREKAAADQARDEARATNRDLHRRAQKAEGKVARSERRFYLSLSSRDRTARFAAEARAVAAEREKAAALGLLDGHASVLRQVERERDEARAELRAMQEIAGDPGAVLSIATPGKWQVAEIIARLDGWPPKRAYNSIGYLIRIGRAKHLGYGVVEILDGALSPRPSGADPGRGTGDASKGEVGHG